MNQVPATVFTLWTLLFSGFTAIGIFFSLKLIGKARTTMDTILGIYLILHSITLLEYTFFWTNFIFQVPVFCELSLLFPLLYGPLLLIYFDRSFGLVKPLSSYSIHFIPFVIFFVLKIPFYLSSAEKKLYHTLDIQFANFFEYYEWIKVAHLLIYCLLIFLRINNQSGIGSMRVWAKSVLGFFFVYTFLMLSYTLIIENGWYTLNVDYVIMLASCLSIAFIAWYGIGFPEIADGQTIVTSLFTISKPIIKTGENSIFSTDPHTETFEKYKNSGLPPSFASELATQLERLMANEKLFSENDLSLNKLAAKLGTNKHFVSQVINQHFKLNFFDYINMKRIEEAKKLLKSSSKGAMNIIDVAYIVGFNNKGTFNSVFKKFTGTTPSEFRAHVN